MFYYAEMQWNLKGMSFNDLWRAEGEECRHAIETIESNMVQHLYKVAAEQKVVVIGNLPSAVELDRTAMGRLPMHEHLLFTEVLSLEEGFTVDVQGYLKPRRENFEKAPRFLYLINLAWDPRSRELDSIWEKLKHNLRTIENGKVLGLYRVAGQQKVLAVVDFENVEAVNKFANVETLNQPEVERVWAMRDYHVFAEDVWKQYNV